MQYYRSTTKGAIQQKVRVISNPTRGKAVSGLRTPAEQLNPAYLQVKQPAGNLVKEKQLKAIG